MSKRTPLYDTHCALGARMVDFAGWSMPVQYTGVMAEHEAVRTAAGLFDVSHMGEFEFTGPDALPCLQYLTANDVSKLSPGQAQYSLLLNPNGGIVDDIIVYCLAANRYLMVVNAGNIDKDWKWVVENKQGEVHLRDMSNEFALIALQGPKAMAILKSVASFPELKRFHCAWLTIPNVGECMVARTGYTGEDGVEIFVAPAHAAALWKVLSDAGRLMGLAPAGLGARDTLRLEMKYPLYGHELSDTTNPIEAGLDWVVKPQKPMDFIGKTAVIKMKTDGPKRQLVGFTLVDKGIPRDGYAIVREKKIIGVVTSGTQSPTLKKAIGVGYVPTTLAAVGSKFSIDIRGTERIAEVVPTPFVKPSY